ncbi:MAG: methylmalonyl Co-A mutase-associated GTPase MeaB [Saprospirales bacterium]|jgi:LAO/AO transport system kinase|nr:methylmalonyl Co-A mutase-associated GTPase MeaB [Saprospirales bacterium]
MARSQLTADDYIRGIRAGNRVMLGRAITLVESARPEHQALAQAVIADLLSTAGGPKTALRVAITGAPGVGKSTFIEALGMQLVEQGKRVAVLAIDPTSSVSKGSILGDKTRMERLATTEQAFIRPSPSGDSLGGVARKTRETILLVEAAGYETVLIETVGVGQSEIAVHRMTDVFVLLLLPGAGDELQGIKRGIVEMADILAVNKADGNRAGLAHQTLAHYLNATHLLPAKASGWTPRVLACSAQDSTGIAAIWTAVLDCQQHALQNGYFQENRCRQAQYWLQEALESGLRSAFFENPRVKAQLAALEPEVLSGRLSPFAAAETILGSFLPAKDTPR